MSESARESLNDLQRRMLLERTIGGPGEWASYWSTFASEFFRGLWQNMPSQAGFVSPSSLQQFLLPGVDVVEEEGELVVRVEMSGFAKQNIHARILDNVLYVSAQREKETDSEKVHFSSRPTMFSRAIWLPVPVERDAKIKAKYDGGVLRVRIPIKTTATVTIE
jgi:HSP20 family molecular chaperone IbpA